MTAVASELCLSGRMRELIEWKLRPEEQSRRRGKLLWFECWISHCFVLCSLGAFQLDAIGAHISRLNDSADPYQARLGLLLKARLELAYGNFDEGAQLLESFIEKEERDGPDNFLPGGVHSSSLLSAWSGLRGRRGGGREVGISTDDG